LTAKALRCLGLTVRLGLTESLHLSEGLALSGLKIESLVEPLGLPTKALGQPCAALIEPLRLVEALRLTVSLADLALTISLARSLGLTEAHL